MYLSEDAILWWRRREADIRKGTYEISTWDALKADFKRQFYHESAQAIALKKLRALMYTGSIKEYVKQYSTLLQLLLEIDNLEEEVSLLYFMDGLQRWGDQELNRRDGKTVAEAIAVAEFLYKNSSDPKRDKVVKKGGNKEKGGGAPTNHGSSSSRGKFSKDKGKSKEKSSSEDKGRHNDCFLCGGMHWFEFEFGLGKQNLIVIVAAYEDRSDDEARKGSLRLLNKTVKEEPKTDVKKLRVLPRSNGLVYVDAIGNGKCTKSSFNYSGRSS